MFDNKKDCMRSLFIYACKHNINIHTYDLPHVHAHHTYIYTTSPCSSPPVGIDDKIEYEIGISYFNGGRHGAVGHPRWFLHMRPLLIDLSGCAFHVSRALSSVAWAALAPSTTVVATSAAIPILAAATAVRARTAGAAAEGGHCSEGKDQHCQCEGLHLHGHVGCSHSKWYELGRVASLA
jgi:hypothetical protein